MYKVAVYNEHHIRAMLMKDDIDFNKFYKEQLIDFINVSRKETEKYKELYRAEKNKNEKAIEYILNNKLYCFKYDDEELFEITTDKKAKDELLNILGGGDDNE